MNYSNVMNGMEINQIFRTNYTIAFDIETQTMYQKDDDQDQILVFDLKTQQFKGILLPNVDDMNLVNEKAFLCTNRTLHMIVNGKHLSWKMYEDGENYRINPTPTLHYNFNRSLNCDDIFQTRLKLVQSQKVMILIGGQTSVAGRTLSLSLIHI